MMGRMRIFVEIVVMALLCRRSDAGQLELQVYRQIPTIDEFLYQKDLPEMTENTICMWINLGADNDGYSDDFLFSISEPNEDNMYLMGFGTNFFVYINRLDVDLPQLTANVLHLFLGWHKHCLTWKSGETLQWYAETNATGEMELLQTVSVFSYTMPAGGALILMQEQDSFFGSLDLGQATFGKVAWFNMWNYSMTDDEIKRLRCRDEGNVVTWDTLSQQGSHHMHFESFDCKGELAPLPRQHGQLQSYKTFCVVSGAMLNMTSLLEEKVDSLNRCVLRCTREVDCLSANFNKTSGVCQMLDDIDQGNEGDFVLVDDINLKYITTRECVE